MYEYAYDKHAGVMVGVLARPFTEDDDNQALLDSIAKQQADAPGPGAKAVFVLAVDPQYPQPNARWRRRFAEARDGVRFAKTFFAVVTPEATLRGVLTAVNWIRPTSERLEADSFATFDEALRWAEEKRGRAARPLRMLMEEVQAKLGFSPEATTSTHPRRTIPPPTAKPATTK